MKSITFKIGICLAIIYATGFLWLPEKPRIWLYTFGQEREFLLTEHESSRFASKKCFNESNENYQKCRDEARSSYRAQNR